MAMTDAEFDSYLTKLVVPPPPNAPGLWSDVKRGAGQVVQSTGSYARDVAPDAGAWLETLGQEIVERNPASIATMDDILASPGTALREGVGEGIGQFGPQIASALTLARLGAMAGGALGPAGALTGGLVGGGLGMFLPSYVQNTGGTRMRQREKGMNSGEDIAAAHFTGGLAGALDAATGVQGTALKLMGKAGAGLTEKAARELAEQGLLKTLAKETGKAAVWEGPVTEPIQDFLSKIASDDPLADRAAISDYVVGAFKGAAGGGAIGGAMAPVTRANASKFVGQIDDARGTLAAPLASLDQLPVKQQAADFLSKVTANDFGGAQALAFAQAQSEAVVQDRDVLLESIAQQKEADTQAKEQDEAETAEIEALYAQQEQQQKLVELLAKLKEKTPESVKYEPASQADVSAAEPAILPALEMPGVDFSQLPLPEAVALMPTVQPRLSGLPMELEQPAPPVMLPPPVDTADRLRAALHQLQLGSAEIPQAEDSVEQAVAAHMFDMPGSESRMYTAEDQLDSLQQLATDLQKISGFDPKQGFGPLAGAVPGSPLLTKEGRARVLPRPIQPVVLEDLAVDLTQRIDNAVAAQEIAPEVGAPIKDAVAGLDTNDYNKFKTLRTQFETLREAPDGPTRPAPSVAPESPPQGGVVAGGSVDVTGATGSQPDAGVQPRTAGGLVASVEPPVPVADTPAQAVAPAEAVVAETEAAPSLDGIIVDRVYEVEGKKIKMKVDAGKTVTDMDTQMSLLKQLISCLA